MPGISWQKEDQSLLAFSKQFLICNTDWFILVHAAQKHNRSYQLYRRIFYCNECRLCYRAFSAWYFNHVHTIWMVDSFNSDSGWRIRAYCVYQRILYFLLRLGFYLQPTADKRRDLFKIHGCRSADCAVYAWIHLSDRKPWSICNLHVGAFRTFCVPAWSIDFFDLSFHVRFLQCGIFHYQRWPKQPSSNVGISELLFRDFISDVFRLYRFSDFD